MHTWRDIAAWQLDAVQQKNCREIPGFDLMPSPAAVASPLHILPNRKCMFFSWPNSFALLAICVPECIRRIAVGGKAIHFLGCPEGYSKPSDRARLHAQVAQVKGEIKLFANRIFFGSKGGMDESVRNYCTVHNILQVT